MSAQENHSELEVFESVTQYNYQEAAKQRATRTRLTTSKQKGHRHGTRPRPDQSRSPEPSLQADCSCRTHPRERTSADCLPGGCITAQEPSREIQRKEILDARSTHTFPIPSQLELADAKQSLLSFPTPCAMTGPHTSLPFAFTGMTEVPTLSSMAFVEDNGISGLGTGTISDQSFHQGSHPQPAPSDFQETCRGQFHPYSNIHASTLQLYNLPTEPYNLNHRNFEFPFQNNHSFHLTDPNLHRDWFSG